MAESAANGASSTLAADIAAGATTITIQAGDTGKFPSSGTYRVALSDGTHVEVCTVTGGQGTASLTVTRASEPYAGLQSAFGFSATGPPPTAVTQVLTKSGLAGLILPLTGSLAARPATGTAGRFYVATDQTPLQVYVDSGSAWSLAGGISDASSTAAGNVNLTPSSTWTTVASIVLTAGRWLVVAWGTGLDTTVAAHIDIRIWDGSVSLASNRATSFAASDNAASSCAAIVIPSTSTTYSLQMEDASSGNGLAVANATGAGANSCGIVATRHMGS